MIEDPSYQATDRNVHKPTAKIFHDDIYSGLLNLPRIFNKALIKYTIATDTIYNILIELHVLHNKVNVSQLKT